VPSPSSLCERAQLTAHCSMPAVAWMHAVGHRPSYAPQEPFHSPTDTHAWVGAAWNPRHTQLAPSAQALRNSVPHVQGTCSDGCGLAVFAGGMGGMRPASRGGMAPPGTGYGGPPPSTGMRGGVRTRLACMQPHAAAPSPPSPKSPLTRTDAPHALAQMGLPPGSRGGAGLRPGSGMRGAAGMQGAQSRGRLLSLRPRRLQTRSLGAPHTPPVSPAMTRVERMRAAGSLSSWTVRACSTTHSSVYLSSLKAWRLGALAGVETLVSHGGEAWLGLDLSSPAHDPS
jgi:hypothetical protein